MKILVLGAGKMVEALLNGILPDENKYYFYSPSGVSAEKLAAKFNAQAVDKDLIPDPDFIVLAHKPQQLGQVAKELNGRFKEIPFISMLAAIDEQTHKKVLGATRIARIMPNLNVRFKRGVTLVSSVSFHKDELKFTLNWLSPTGLCLHVSEDQLNELTLLTGCGPALFFQFAIYLSKSFKSLPASELFKLTEQIMKGSAELLQEYPGDFEAAIKDVSSKGGVTEAILRAWDENHLNREIEKGIMAGRARSEKIQESILQN